MMKARNRKSKQGPLRQFLSKLGPLFARLASVGAVFFCVLFEMDKGRGTWTFHV